MHQSKELDQTHATTAREARPVSVERTVIGCANADGGESPSALKNLSMKHVHTYMSSNINFWCWSLLEC